MPGTLFVVATPIGNLEDLTFRALRTLKEVDVIAAEDTRRTSKLLAHYSVSKPLVSLHEHNEFREAPRLVARLLRGESIALVSDAGTPGISDPGTTLVRLAREAGVAISPIPGPSAITAAISVSGLPATPFVFLGFPPASGAARERWFEQLHQTASTVVFFEAPHRIRATAGDLEHVCPNRPILVMREITKKNEILVFRDNVADRDATEPMERGEIVVVIGPTTSHHEHQSAHDHKLLDWFGQMREHLSLSEDHTLAAIAGITGYSVPRILKILKKARIAVKRSEERSNS